MNPFVQAVLIGLLYWFCRTNMFHTFTTRLANCPMALAVPIGIIMGDVRQAVIIGAFVQALYVGIIAGLGGVVAIDKALATCLSIPIAMKAGMTPELAVTMAIPFGLLGTVTVNIFKMVMTYFVHVADRYAEEGDARKIRLLAFVYPLLVGLPLNVIPVTAIVYLGPDVVSSLLGLIPDALVHGLSVAGGILPALGFAMTMRTIGQRRLLPFFFAGFFLIQYFKLNTVGAAIFGTIIAITYVQLQGGERSVA